MLFSNEGSFSEGHNDSGDEPVCVFLCVSSASVVMQTTVYKANESDLPHHYSQPSDLAVIIPEVALSFLSVEAHILHAVHSVS